MEFLKERYTEKLTNMKLKIRGLKAAVYIICLLPAFLGGCGVYSFTGANISPDIKTISIQNFYDDSGEGPANLSQILTEDVRDYFQQNTNLSLVQEEGDLQLEGSITGYRLSPVAPTATGNDLQTNEAGLTRLTITVHAVYVNTQDDTFNFDQNFSFYADFDPRVTTLQQEEDRLIEEIFEAIVFDIFNASVANW